MSASRLRTVAKLAAEGISKRASYTSRHISPYEKTIQNLKINEHSRVIYQGFTGQVATKNATDTIAYGTKVLGGVTLNPDKETHLDLPLFGSVKDAAKELKPDVSAVFIRGALAAEAIIDAIEAEIPLIVSVAEHVPAHDMLRVHEVLRTQSKSRLVGPNGPGIIAPEQCRVGIMPYLQYKRGRIGIVSRSGTLSYEAVGATTELGLGQSLVVGVGGDLTPGTNFTDALKVFFEHEETEGIIMIGEIGGEAEIEAADLIAEYRRSTPNPKPIVGMIAGQSAPKRKIMGHAGAVQRSEMDVPAAVKMKALEEAGVAVVGHAGALGQEIAQLLSGKPLPQVMPKIKPKIDIKQAIEGGRRSYD